MLMGSIQKIDRPKPWRARYRALDGKERSRSFMRKVDAERWLRNELASQDRGAWTDPSAGRVLFEEWVTRSLRGRVLKPKTRAGYEELLRSLILPKFGDLELRHISSVLVREWQADLLETGLSPARVRQARGVIHAALDLAVEDGLLANNPVAKVAAPKVRARRQRFLTEEEVDSLAEACDRRQGGSGTLVRFLAYSGLRWGEAVALRRQHIEPEHRRVRVEESATEVGGRLEWGKPKSHETRTVILPRFVIDELVPRLYSMSSEDLVFTAPRGGPLRGPNFRNRVWSPAVAEAELPSDLVPHDLRDTAASLMIASGASIKAVQRALGHASGKVTLDIYGGLFEEDLEALADRMEERHAARRGHSGQDSTRSPRSTN